MILSDVLLECKLLFYGIKNKNYLLKLTPDLFTDKLNRYAYFVIKRYFEEKKNLPSIDYLRVELSNNGIATPAEAMSVIKTIEKCKNENDFHILLKKAKDLMNLRNWNTKLQRASTLLEKGKLKEIESIFNQNLNLQPQSITNIKPMNLSEIKKTFNKKESISTGFAELDNAIGGFYRQDLIVIAAPAKSAKSAFLMNVWFNAYKQGYKSLFLSLEMAKLTIEKRLTAMLTHTPYKDLKSQKLTPEEIDIAKREFLSTFFSKKKTEKLLTKYSKLPLHQFLHKTFLKIPNRDNLLIYSSYSARLNDLLPEILTIEPDLIVIDYLSWLEPQERLIEGKMWEKLGAISKELKALARRLDAAVVTAMQLTDDNKKLKYSRMVAENSDLVIKWQLDSDGVIKTYKMETMYARNCAPFDDLYLIAKLDTMELDIKRGVPTNG